MNKWGTFWWFGPIIPSLLLFIIIKWSRGVKLWSQLSVIIRTGGILLLGPIILLKLTIIRRILAVIWPIILLMRAEILSITLSVDLLWVMWCEIVYWAFFWWLIFRCCFLLKFLFKSFLVIRDNS